MLRPAYTVLFICSVSAYADVATWSTGSGNWTNPAEWACVPGPVACVPNDGTPANTYYQAILNSPGNTLSLSNASTPAIIDVTSLSLQAGTLRIGSGASFASGAGLNSGVIVAEAGGSISFPGGAQFGNPYVNAGTISIGAGSVGVGVIRNTGIINVTEPSMAPTHTVF